MKKSIIDRLTDLVYGLDSRPDYVTENKIVFELNDMGVDIRLFENYGVTIQGRGSTDCSVTVEGDGLSYSDVAYAMDVMDMRDEIMDIVDEWVKIIND